MHGSVADVGVLTYRTTGRSKCLEVRLAHRYGRGRCLDSSIGSYFQSWTGKTTVVLVFKKLFQKDGTKWKRCVQNFSISRL